MGHMQHILSDSQTLEERPSCIQCHSRMWLVRIEPCDRDHERRIYECQVCERSDEVIVKFRAE